jgi:3-oxoacyl-[acyl-carrier protein] reductase
MIGKFEGKTAIVTGAGSGIGEAVACAFLELGANVLAVDLSQDRLAAVWNGTEGSLRLMGQDVSGEFAATTIAQKALNEFGAIDILVNCAGISRFAKLEDMTLTDWNETVAINLTAVFRLCQEVSRHMAGRPFGRIINIGSAASERSDYGMAAYTATKGGVASLSRALAMDVGGMGITVNYVLPGFILSGMTQPVVDQVGSLDAFAAWGAVNRIGFPKDVAHAVLFLASEESSFITGHGLPVDGGFLIKADFSVPI